MEQLYKTLLSRRRHPTRSASHLNGTVHSIDAFYIMPRYHFHIVDGVEVFDSAGVTLPDNEAARRRALELATNIGKTRWPHRPPKAVRVTNNEGAILFRVPIRRSA
jgi:Domain of unknown function (DUF6894)